MMVPLALNQLATARLPAICAVVYLALPARLDWGEYRTVSAQLLADETGLSLSGVHSALVALSRAGFLDVRGDVPRKYRLLLSQRTVVGAVA